MDSYLRLQFSQKTKSRLIFAHNSHDLNQFSTIIFTVRALMVAKNILQI